MSTTTFVSEARELADEYRNTVPAEVITEMTDYFKDHGVTVTPDVELAVQVIAVSLADLAKLAQDQGDTYAYTILANMSSVYSITAADAGRAYEQETASV